VDINELAPDMRHAGHLADVTGTIEVFEPGIAVSVDPALICCEMILWALPFAVWRELIPAGGCGVAAQGRSSRP
jgi:hypothetical protein